MLLGCFHMDQEIVVQDQGVSLENRIQYEPKDTLSSWHCYDYCKSSSTCQSFSWKYDASYSKLRF